MAATSRIWSANAPCSPRCTSWAGAGPDSSHQPLFFCSSKKLHWAGLKSTARSVRSKPVSSGSAFALRSREEFFLPEDLVGGAQSLHLLHRCRSRPLSACASSDERTTTNSHQLESSLQFQSDTPEQLAPHRESIRGTEPKWLAPLSRRQLILLSSTVSLLSLPSAPASALENLPAGLTLPSWKGDNQLVQLVIGDGCGLGVSIYPDFEYNAGGKGGIGTARKEKDGRIFVRFDPATLEIPPVQFSTTKLLTLPLPPPLKIEIVPKKLEGYIEPQSGKVELDFLAEFLFTIGPLYEAKPLVVGTTLTTESSQGPLRNGQGQRLDADGRCVLAGVARVVPVKDALLDPFLMLPTDCLAKLPAQFIFSS